MTGFSGLQTVCNRLETVFVVTVLKKAIALCFLHLKKWNCWPRPVPSMF